MNTAKHSFSTSPFSAVVLAAALLSAVGIGVALGAVLGETRNIQSRFDVGSYTPALPTLLLDRSGRLVSEYFAEEKREIVSLYELPDHLVFAVITKEDRTFFRHSGFSPKGIARAAWNILAGHYFSGGSTISQQVAGHLYEDRSVSTLGRKLQELWWSFQLEKNRSKHEILEIYLNNSEFGHGTYGVEAASQFYFGKSAREIDLAEAAILTVQLSNPATRSMINYPNRARLLQEDLMDTMVELGYADRTEADASLAGFWDEYDRTRSNVSTVRTERVDRAPEFSEYVRQQFESLFYGSPDLYRDGFVIHSTLDLGYQRVGERLVRTALVDASDRIEFERARVLDVANATFQPLVGLLELAFDIEELGFREARARAIAEEIADGTLVPLLSAVSLLLNLEGLNASSGVRAAAASGSPGGMAAGRAGVLPSHSVQGALVAIENTSGEILAMVFGDADSGGKPLRLMDEGLQVGTALIPLLVSYALETQAVTAGSMFYDSPIVVQTGEGPFAPVNLHGLWYGPVRTRRVVAESLVVPALKIFDAAGPAKTLQRLASMLGLPSAEAGAWSEAEGYRIASGELAVTPLQLTAAYAVLANGGLPVLPFAIRFIEDRYGNVIYSSDELLKQLAGKKRVVTAWSADIVTDLMTSTVTDGALAGRVAAVGGFDGMPMAAAVGTSSGWTDAWTVGYSPHMTASVWIGTDALGYSLGEYQSGAVVAGSVWTRYMQEVHADLPRERFGSAAGDQLITRTVCAISGKLPTDLCDEGTYDEIFLAGTEPTDFCSYHRDIEERDAELVRKLRRFYTTAIPPEALRSLESTLEAAVRGDEAPVETESSRPLPAAVGAGNPLLEDLPGFGEEP